MSLFVYLVYQLDIWHDEKQQIILSYTYFLVSLPTKIK